MGSPVVTQEVINVAHSETDEDFEAPEWRPQFISPPLPSYNSRVTPAVTRGAQSRGGRGSGSGSARGRGGRRGGGSSRRGGGSTSNA